LLIALKGAGETIGWGFQLQNPFVVAALATLLFVIGLNLLGVFDIGGKFVNVGSKLTNGNDVQSSFFTGVLATLVATPCTAPFMASAIGYALTQDAIVSLGVFAFLGFGLAFPYLLLSVMPAAQKIMPKPGAWMNTFKQALSFPMFASAVWLVWVLDQQAGNLAVLYVLGLFLAIGFLIWLFKVTSSKIWRGFFTLILTALFVLYASVLMPKTESDYVAFDSQKLISILEDEPQRPVFVNMTAAWCITCLVNERTSLSSDSVQDAFDSYNVLYMKGDWTNRDDHITQYLESYGRNGVPLYVYYGPAVGNGERPAPMLLPQILTPEIVLNTLKGENEQ
jgi:thiol:disulfide interchange protein DsbD